MAMAKRHPYSPFNFTIHLGGKTKTAHARFQECSGPGLESMPALRHGDATAKRHITKITGMNKSTDVTLKRGVISADGLKAWLDEIKKDGKAHRDIIISLQSEDPKKPPQRWKLLRARIIKHTSGPLNAKSNDVAIEEMVISCEGIELE